EIVRILTRDGEPAETARQLAGGHHEHRDDDDIGAGALAVADPQIERGRHEVEHLHQRLADQPRVAGEKLPLFDAKLLLLAARTEIDGGVALHDTLLADAGGGNGVPAVARGREGNSAGEGGRTE